MCRWQFMMGVVCLALAPALAQITFSRSWVPQGKRSGPMGALMAATSSGAGDSADIADSCQEARLATLSQVAAHIADLMDEAAEDDSNLALRLKHALVARQRKMS